MTDVIDVLVVGGGAAGLMAAIWAARSEPERVVMILDGAAKLGAKILVAGGARCNVTHHEVSPDDYAGGSRNSIKKVLKRFDVDDVVAFFENLNVPLKRESTGKLFPVSDSARDVLNALLVEADRLGIRIHCRKRAEAIGKSADGFEVSGEWGRLSARKLVLATGGKSLPKSGSDGYGYKLAHSLGHTHTPDLFAALVPLCLPAEHFVCGLSGLTLNLNLTVLAPSSKVLANFSNSAVCTHFGLSGPAVLDISRYWTAAYLQDPMCRLQVNWLPGFDAQTLERHILDEGGRKTIRNFLKQHLPLRLVEQLCIASDVAADSPCDQLRKEARKRLVANVVSMPLPVTGDRGFRYAEVTAGGIPLTQIDIKTMQSRVCEGLYLCGEICDVDGRVGGFNFQWAWASGYIVGNSL